MGSGSPRQALGLTPQGEGRVPRDGEARWRRAGGERVLEDRRTPGRISRPERPPVLGIECRQRGHPRQLGPPVRKIQRHDASDREGRLRTPRLRLDTEEEELRRPRTAPRGDAGVDAFRIGLEQGPIRGDRGLQFAAGGRPHVQRPHEPVRIKGRGAEDLGQTPPRDPLEQLHLPQPFGGVHEPLGAHGVDLGLGGDGWNRPLIEGRHDGRRQAREHVAAGSRLHGPLQVKPRERREAPGEQEAGYQDDARPAPQRHGSRDSGDAGESRRAWRSET